MFACSQVWFLPAALTKAHDGRMTECNDRPRPLEGARGWLITDDKIGMLVQCRGVADALGLDYVHKQVNPTGLTRLLSPWILPVRAERLGVGGSLLAPPWPDIGIA